MNQDMILKLAKDTLADHPDDQRADARGFAGGRDRGQHRAGRDLHSGYDSFVCSEDYCGLPGLSFHISLDHEYHAGLYRTALWPSRAVCPLKRHASDLQDIEVLTGFREAAIVRYPER